MRLAVFPLLFASVLFTACSSSSKTQAVIYQAGDKATVGSLVYNMTDAERSQQLGDDPDSARTANQRFYLIKVSVSNSSADETPIPAMTLVDDSGQTYPELSDGTGVQNWLGVVRKVAPAQTESGYVAFDAPARHYRLRLNDPFDEKEISIDVPLSFVHDSARGIQTGTPAGSSPSDTPLQLPGK
jgi:hypothetical protein